MSTNKPSDGIKREGHCLCGAVTITAEHSGNDVGACHCHMCRRWGGGPYLELNCGSEVVIDGNEHVTVFDSSAWAERGFCGKCGSHLFYRLKDADEYMVPVGLFENDAGLVLDHQVFVDEKPTYYSFANSTLEMTGAEVFAKFGAPE